jgi:hypothetical protein
MADGRIVALTPNGVLTRLLGGQREGHGAINIAAGVDVVEDAIQISMEVTRTGGSAGEVSVEYYTNSASATAGEDFTTVSGRLDWSDGDTSAREIVIPILDDTLYEGDEQFAVLIHSPSGGALLLNTQALIRISADMDMPPPPPSSPPSSPPSPSSALSSGGGAADVVTLILLSLLTALRVAPRTRNHVFLMNRRLVFHAVRRSLAPQSKGGESVHAGNVSNTAVGPRAHCAVTDHTVVGGHRGLSGGLRPDGSV